MATANIQRFGGMHTGFEAPANNALLIENFTRDPASGMWDNRIGYEKFFPSGTAWQPFNVLGRVDSLYIWSRHGGAQEWVLLESGGNIYHVVDWGGTFRIDTIVSGTNVPTPSGTAAHYAEFGRFLVITNGTNTPTKYVGWPTPPVATSIPKYPLGWNGPPTAPEVWDVDTTPSTLGAAGETFGMQSDGYGTVTDERGLGFYTANTTNRFKWRVSYYTFGGAESPISLPSNVVTWITAADGNRYTLGMQIPTGPTGTLGRRIYRTMNLVEGVAEVYYFVADIPNNIDTWYYDSTHDSVLTSLAPTEADSVALPANGARYCATFDNRLWIDGGSVEGTRLYYSKQNKPDQFGANDYFEFGMKQGGGIRGIRGFNNMLVVMRENAVDAVRRDGTGDLFVVPLMERIGSIATDTLTEVPGMGVLMLAHDGVYVVSGGLDTGPGMGYQKISKQIDRVFKRMNRVTMARATAAYSHKWREWHCYFAIDGSDINNYGVVYHVDSGDWSVRPNWPVGCITANPEGELVFGHIAGDGQSNGEADTEAGLFVVSRRRQLGSYLVNTGTEENPVWTETPNAAPTSVFRTEWLEFSGLGATNSMYVYAKVRNTGNNTVTLKWYTDYATVGVADSHAVKVLQDTESTKRPVFGTILIDGTAVWQDESFSVIRFDVAPKQCSKIMFEFTSSNDFVLAGVAVDYNVSGNRGITGRTV